LLLRVSGGVWINMIKFSLVIQNTKKEYLICKCPLMERDEFSYEFLGGEIIGNTIIERL